MDYIVYLIFRFIVLIYKITPFWLVYIYSDILCFLLYRVFKYRRAVVKDNLLRCFPEKSETERLDIERKFYKSLSDIFLESIKGAASPIEKIAPRYVMINIEEEVNRFPDQGRPIIMLGAHCANWEWSAVVGGYYNKHKAVAIFKQIKNQYINNYLLKSRENDHFTFRPLRKTKETFEEMFGDGMKIGGAVMVSDQSPTNVKAAHWVNFFGQETAALHGFTKYAQKYDMPIIFFYAHRKKRGYYEFVPKVLIENPNDYKAEEITQIYMSRLEEVIRQYPEQWLWSHKRWKHKRQPDSANKN